MNYNDYYNFHLSKGLKYIYKYLKIPNDLSNKKISTYDTNFGILELKNGLEKVNK